MSDMFLVMAGGAAGAALRFHVGRWVSAFSSADWPMATLIVNLAGGLAMGVLAGLLARKGLSEGWRLLFGVGLLGGFTTFSAFSLEMMTMIEADRWAAAGGYALLSVAGSVAMLALGLTLVRGL